MPEGPDVRKGGQKESVKTRSTAFGQRMVGTITTKRRKKPGRKKDSSVTRERKPNPHKAYHLTRSGNKERWAKLLKETIDQRR